jgi:hypothetical protein
LILHLPFLHATDKKEGRKKEERKEGIKGGRKEEFKSCSDEDVHFSVSEMHKRNTWVSLTKTACRILKSFIGTWAHKISKIVKILTHFNRRSIQSLQNMIYKHCKNIYCS